MRVVVIGASGFLGRHVVAALVGRIQAGELDLVCAGRSEPVMPLPGEFRLGDRTDSGFVQELMDLRPDVWVDLALFEPAEMDALAAAWERSGRPARSIVVAGSIAEYGLSRRHWLPVSEDVPLDADGAYGQGKAAACNVGFRAFRHTGLPLCWTVLPQLWGPGDPHGRDSRWSARLTDGDAVLLRGNGRTLLPDGYVETAAAALVHLALDTGAAGMRVNVAGPTCITPLSYLRWAAAALRCPLHVRHASPEAMSAAERASTAVFRAPFGDYDFCLDLSRLAARGFVAPLGAEEGVRRTALWHASRLPGQSETAPGCHGLAPGGGVGRTGRPVVGRDADLDENRIRAVLVGAVERCHAL